MQHYMNYQSNPELTLPDLHWDMWDQQTVTCCSLDVPTVRCLNEAAKPHGTGGEEATEKQIKGHAAVCMLLQGSN